MKKNNATDRRVFIKSSLASAALIAIGAKGLGKSLFHNQHKETVNNPVESIITGFDQMPLPYSYDALEDVIDRATMEIHYSKHAAGYSKNLKEAVIAEKVDSNKTVESLLSNISTYSTKLRNNAGGHFNHEMFWQCMQPKTINNAPQGSLLKSIETQFGSLQNFKNQFADAAKSRFGSGWAWLYKNNQGELKIGSTANQDNPLMDPASVEHKGFPLLCLDVWEHAYYLKYQNKRADYIENWWNLVNWNYVSQRFDHQ
jgi:Fe-Mn family superoxide dismutase